MPSDHTDQSANLDFQRKIDIVEAGLIKHIFRDSNTEYILEPGWVQSISRHIPAPMANRIWFSVLPESEADERIEQTIAMYQSLQLPMMWMISPSSRPVDLPTRLIARGFRFTARVRGMFAPVDKLVGMADHAPADEIRVEPIRESDLNDWIEMIASGWTMLPEARRALDEKVRRRYAEDGDKIIYVLARCGAVPCGAALVELRNEFGLLMSGFVQPEYRRRGVFRALVKKRAELLQKRTIPYAVMHAHEQSSAPLARNMGFDDVCEMTAYTLA